MLDNPRISMNGITVNGNSKTVKQMSSGLPTIVSAWCSFSRLIRRSGSTFFVASYEDIEEFPAVPDNTRIP